MLQRPGWFLIPGPYGINLQFHTKWFLSIICYNDTTLPFLKQTARIVKRKVSTEGHIQTSSCANLFYIFVFRRKWKEMWKNIKPSPEPGEGAVRKQTHSFLLLGTGSERVIVIRLKESSLGSLLRSLRVVLCLQDKAAYSEKSEFGFSVEQRNAKGLFVDKGEPPPPNQPVILKRAGLKRAENFFLFMGPLFFHVFVYYAKKYYTKL